MPTKLELNKTYYKLNKEKLKEKRRQRYLLNKKSEQSFNKLSEQKETEQLSNSEQTEQKENVQLKVSEQLGLNKTEPSLNTFNLSEQKETEHSEQFPTEQKENSLNTAEQSQNVQNKTEQTVKPCSRCPEIENSISNFANLYRQEQEKVKEQKRINYQLEKKIKELEQSQQELLKPINPTIELWKGRYFDLEKKSDERWKELEQTILRLKEKLREKDKENTQWEQKYNQTQLLNLAQKYKKFFTIQRNYTREEIQELKHLQKLANELNPFIGLLAD